MGSIKPTGTRPHQIHIVGWAPDDSRWEVVEDVCAACGAQIHRFSTLTRVLAISRPHPYCAAIVALQEHPENLCTCLTVVSKLKDVGLTAIAYENGINSWPIGTRCRALLAGAKCLVDSRDVNFKNRLHTILKELLAELHEQRNEENGIKNLARSHGIIGESESLLESFRQLIRFSKLSDLPVLIFGKSGTGKELFASALHALDSKRCRSPFVTVNCAAINAGVAESELFGHVKGAFTGAGYDRGGYFLAAQGGVLFLDEIGELSLDVQAKILRVVQEKRFFRVGAEHEVPVDIRVVAATNRNLLQMVKEGRFREDLFHRLNMLSIGISPLRERKADLPFLVQHFVSLHECWRGYTEVAADLIDALSCLELRGNVRELKNLITAALAAKTDSGPLGLKDLPTQVWEELADTHFAGAAPEVRPTCGDRVVAEERLSSSEMHSLALSLTHRQGWNLHTCLSQCEREIIEAAIFYTRNNQSQAARLLGLTPRSIYNKLRKHQLLRKSTIN